MTRLQAGVLVVAALAPLAGAHYYVTKQAVAQPAPTTAAEFVGTVRRECDATCSPLRARWTVAELGDSTATEPKFLGRCECAEPPNIGTRPKLRPKVALREE